MISQFWRNFDFLDSGIFLKDSLSFLGRSLGCLRAFLVSLKFVYVNILSHCFFQLL